MRKKTIVVAVCIFMVFAMMFSACGKNTSKTPSSGASDSSGKEATTESSKDAKSGKVMPADVAKHKFARIDMVNQLPEKPLRIAFLTIQTNAFFDMVVEGAKQGVEYLKQFGVQVDYINIGSVMDADTVNNALDAAIVQKYDGIVVTPFNPGTEVYIDKAVDAGIPVITLYGESTVPSKRFLFIGQDAYAAGKQVGEYVAGKYPEGGKYGIETAIFGVQVFEERNRGFEDGLKSTGADWERVGIYETHDSAETIYSQVKDMITAHPDLKCVYVSSGGNYGASKAIEEVGLSDQVISAGHDEVPENLAYVAKDQMVVISQDTSGVSFSSLIHMYNYLVAGEKPESDYIPSESIMIDSSNVADWQ